MPVETTGLSRMTQVENKQGLWTSTPSELFLVDDRLQPTPDIGVRVGLTVAADGIDRVGILRSLTVSYQVNDKGIVFIKLFDFSGDYPAKGVGMSATCGRCPIAGEHFHI